MEKISHPRTPFFRFSPRKTNPRFSWERRAGGEKMGCFNYDFFCRVLEKVDSGFAAVDSAGRRELIGPAVQFVLYINPRSKTPINSSRVSGMYQLEQATRSSNPLVPRKRNESTQRAEPRQINRTHPK
jgi:hypothetical protein